VFDLRKKRDKNRRRTRLSEEEEEDAEEQQYRTAREEEEEEAAGVDGAPSSTLRLHELKGERKKQHICARGLLVVNYLISK
jgi:hypothetical protein